MTNQRLASCALQLSLGLDQDGYQNYGTASELRIFSFVSDKRNLYHEIDLINLGIPMEQLIYELETSLLNPSTRKSVEKLNELIANDFVEFGSSGRVYTKEDILKYLPIEEHLDLTVEDFIVKELAQNVMLATYRLKGCLRSSIWKNTNGKWQMVFHQGTRVNNKGISN